jgi:hypothetical protein
MQEVRAVLHQSLTRRNFSFPLPPSTLVNGSGRTGSDTGTGVAGTGPGPAFHNRMLLSAEGLSNTAIERLQTALMVYSLGFYDVMNEVRAITEPKQRAEEAAALEKQLVGGGDEVAAESHAPPPPVTEAHIWKMFLHLLNQCKPPGLCSSPYFPCPPLSHFAYAKYRG